MRPAYEFEGERSYILWIENRAKEKGFEAAKRRKLLQLNPYHKKYEMYQYVAWASGWHCFNDYGKMSL